MVKQAEPSDDSVGPQRGLNRGCHVCGRRFLCVERRQGLQGHRGTRISLGCVGQAARLFRKDELRACEASVLSTRSVPLAPRALDGASATAVGSAEVGGELADAVDAVTVLLGLTTAAVPPWRWRMSWGAVPLLLSPPPRPLTLRRWQGSETGVVCWLGVGPAGHIHSHPVMPVLGAGQHAIGAS